MTHRRLLVASCVILAFTAGCDARYEVAKDNALKQIDTLLGTIDVKRKEVDAGIKMA